MRKIIFQQYSFKNRFSRGSTSQEVKTRHFGIKQIRFAQFLIRIQKSDFIKRTKTISFRVHLCIQPILIQISNIKNLKWWIQNGGHVAKIMGENSKNRKIEIVGSKIYKMCMK